MSTLAQPVSNDQKAGFVDRLLAWYEEAGRTRYDDEVDQAAHALQTAWLARQAEASPALIVAALFHDIGHLLIDEHSERGDFLRQDRHHETVGAIWLATAFPESVAAPVRLHVPAKRWLCAREPAYHDKLSRSSRRSLALQGGAMSGNEAAAFEDQPHWREAVAIRKWDDDAKVAGRKVPGFADYRDMVLALVQLPGN